MKPLTVLAWDTATTWTCAALVRFDETGGYEVLAEFEREGGPSHSQILPPQMEAMLKGAAVAPKELDLIVAGRGPGSFTGLRTGLSLAKGLAMGAAKPLMGIPTLQTLAARLIFEEGAALAAPVIDARHNEIFTALYQAAPQAGGLELTCVMEPRPIDPAQFAPLMESLGQPITVAGPALALVRPHLSPPLTPGPSPLTPSAVMAARLAAARFKAGGPSLAANPALPMYIRQPDIRQSGLAMK